VVPFLLLLHRGLFSFELLDRAFFAWLIGLYPLRCISKRLQ
jgi:hypothetical protein